MEEKKSLEDLDVTKTVDTLVKFIFILTGYR
jgi:hypothetical protein